MDLTSIESRLVAALEFNAQEPIVEIARRLKIKASTATYMVRRLQERGIIRRGIVINFFRLGYQLVTVFFSVRGASAGDRARFISRLRQHNQVAWFGALAGDYQYGVAFLIRSLADVYRLLEQAAQESKITIVDKAVVPRLSVTFLNRGYLADHSANRKSIVLTESDQAAFIADPLDHKILSYMANKTFESLREVAAYVGSPLTTVARRIESLQAEGVIAAFVYFVAADQMGRSSYRLLIEASGLDQKIRSRIRKFWDAHPATVLAMESLGPWDYEIDIEITNQQELLAIREELTELVEGRLESIKVLGEIEDYRFSLYPF